MLARIPPACNSARIRRFIGSVNVDIQQAVKPLRKLRKLLKNFPDHPTPEDVHDLRTRSRRVEASIHALAPRLDAAAERLLKHLKPLRRAAGRVRDMDVLFSKLCRLSGDSGAQAVIQLGQHLSNLRQRHADRLRHVVRRRGARVRRELKRFACSLEHSVAGKAHIYEAPQVLAHRLQQWPKLTSGNLHEFRIVAKELRYMLQLSNGVPQPRLSARLDALDQTKDIAGEWHDWVELRTVAQDVLDPEADREILRQITAITREKLHQALAAANRVRGRKTNPPRAA
jgi:CHAD domain-containing protein